YRLFWHYHHLILVGWCNSLILTEVFERYEAYRQGIALGLAPAKPYSSYMSWLLKQDMKQAEYFWKQDLNDYREPVSLPLARYDSS
ncbi:condensation domain-containing protein, partial [Paenibacillus sp. GbtcB18]|uniref:condensation domain-containing protein n=1 Tax=Paenibacillus sp. GbtcB18 TaxID=2824763 RepID=UPI001C2FD9C4